MAAQKRNKKTNQKLETPSNEPLPVISLRPFKASDVRNFMAWACDENANEFSNRDTFDTKEDALEELKTELIQHRWCRALCYKGIPIGEIFFHQDIDYDSDDDFEDEEITGEITYTLAPAYWESKVAIIGLKSAVSTLFKEFEYLERIEVLIDVEDVRRQREVDEVGFCEECVLRKYRIIKGRAKDLVIYSILRDESRACDVSAAAISFQELAL